jgi:hypothetical protein
MAAVALAQIRASESREALEEAATSLSWLRSLQARRALRSLRPSPTAECLYLSVGSQKALPRTAVGRDLLDHPLAFDEVQPVEALA